VARYTPGKDPVPIVQEGWVGPQGRSGRMRKISPHTGIRSPDLPARSESLYRLSYPGLSVSKVKVKVILEQATEAQRCSCTLSLTSALHGGWVVSTTPRPLYPRERPGTHCTGGLGGPPGAVWTGAENHAPHRDSIPGPSSP
jgi:hypothetical protein